MIVSSKCCLYFAEKQNEPKYFSHVNKEEIAMMTPNVIPIFAQSIGGL